MGILLTRYRSAYGLIAAIAISALCAPHAVAQEIECPDGGQITITRDLGPGVVDDGKTVNFTYTITGPEGSGFVTQTTLAVSGGQRDSTILQTPTSMVGEFTVHEDASDAQVPQSSDVVVTIEQVSDCTAQVLFVNATEHGTGTVRVLKTETSGAFGTRLAKGKWTFTLTGGPEDVTRTKTTNRGKSSYRLRFRDLAAGAYTLCEHYTGWISDLGKSKGSYQPNGDRCVDFDLVDSDVRTFRVNNRCPLTPKP